MTPFSLVKNYPQWFRQNIAGGIALLSLPLMWYMTLETLSNPDIFSDIRAQQSSLTTGLLTMYAVVFVLRFAYFYFKPEKIRVQVNESSLSIGDNVISFDVCQSIQLEIYDRNSLLLSRINWYNKAKRLKCSPEGYSATIKATEFEVLLRDKVQITVQREQSFFRSQED